jgi:hypothetical protein
MYVCQECFNKYPGLIEGFGMGGGNCELHGHLEDRWHRSGGIFLKNVRRPVGERDPKKYILDQLDRAAHGANATEELMLSFGVRMSRLTATKMRDFMDGFRKAMAKSEDPYKKGQHDAFDFMIKQIDQDLERESA